MTQGNRIDTGIDWLDRRTGLQRIGLLLLAGAATGFSFAPFYLFPLLVISYPLLLLVLFKSRRLLEAFAFGWWFGFGQFFTGLIWIATAFEVDGRYPGIMGYLAVASLAVLLAMFTGLATGGLWRLFKDKDPQRYALSITLSFVVLWTVMEWLRGHIFTGFPWNLTGYVWGFSDVMLQTTALWGIYGLGLFTLFLVLIPYLLIQNIRQGKSIHGILAAGLLMGLGLGGYGMVQLSSPTEFRDDVRLRIVQANISQKDKWDPAKKAENFLKHLRMSKSTPEEGVTHVIWPETAVIYFLDTEPSRRYLIADMLNEGAVLMTGFPRVERSPAFKAWNSFVVVDSQGNVQNIYDKYHLVPFGEYTPDILRGSLSFLGLGMLVEGFSYSRGTGLRTLHSAGTPPVGILICYEIIFPGAVVDQNDRPDWLLNVTNDAWYGSFSGPYQHLLQTRVRAIEEGLPIVRSAGTGVSAVIDAYGRVIKSTTLNKQGVIMSFLPVNREGATLYSRNSSWIFMLLVVVFWGFSILFQRQ
ncbi:MAG: apolipoprotein N-acyltransferase [Emcibacter sp.]|nr:apolipoprotein N-acyltransferase [Emcibacter sp.]